MCEISGSYASSREAFLYAAKAGAILGSLQAGYTNFRYVSSASKEITDREALLGVSITGWMTNPDILFDEQNLRDAAGTIRDINVEMAVLLGTNQAARTTAVKPSGNASVILGCASGIHGEHSPRYFRNVQMNMQQAVPELLAETNPKMVEASRWSPNKTDVVVSFPITAKEDSIFKSNLYGVKQLEYVKRAQQIWIEAGTNEAQCVDPRLRHNVSNTISVDNWDEVEEYIYQNRHFFAGISLLGSSGDRDYVQAPFCEVFTEEQLVQMYGTAALFASGLIVDGVHAFGDNLWGACDTFLGHGEELDEEDSKDMLKRDWIRRAGKFAKNYFEDDKVKATYCLKDVYNLHRWESITRSFKPVDFSMDLKAQEYTDVSTLGAQGCSGGACEVSWT